VTSLVPDVATPKRSSLLLVGETVDDRRVIASILDEAEGARSAVVIPTGAKGRSRKLRIGQELLVLALAPDRRSVVPIRFVTVADIETGSQLASIAVELDGRPTIEQMGLVQAFAEARGISPDRARIHTDGPPVASATPGEDAWLRAAQFLSDLDPDGYRDTAFLCETNAGRKLRLFAPGVDSSRLPDLTLSFIDASGAVLRDVPGASLVEVPPKLDAVRVEVQHRWVTGGLTLRPGREQVDGAREAVDIKPAAPHLNQSTVALAQPVFEAYGVLQLLEEKSSLSPDLVAEVAERLAQADPSDFRLPMRRARALLEGSKPDQAVEVLRQMPAERRPAAAEAVLLVAELADGQYEIPLDRYGRAQFDDWTFGRLVDTVASLPPAPAASTTESLMMVLSESRAATLVARVGPQLPAGPSLIAIAGRIAAVSPSEALDLIKRAGPLDGLPTALVQRMFELQRDTDDADIAPATMELARRCCADGNIDGAVTAAESVRHRLHWRDAQAVADVILDAFVKSPPEWSDERMLQAMAATSLMEDAIRGLKDVDLGEALEVAARLRQALEPAPADVTSPLTALEEELYTALESTEAHRAALELLSEASLRSLRQDFNGKRLFVVGGRRPDWWDQLLVDLALDRASTWREVEPGRRPSMDWLKAKIGGGKIDLLVVITDYIAHATSAVADYARDRQLTVAKARAGRHSFLTALRATKVS
jgi:hypothetical protein